MANPFSKTTLAIVIGVAAVSIVATVVLTLVGDDLSEKPSAGVDGYSVSAIGHKGLVQLLEKLDVPVVTSRSSSAEKAKNGLLVIAEPTVTDDASRDKLEALITGSPRTLIVLPKWYGTTERGREWIEDADFISTDEIEPILKVLHVDDAKLVRLKNPATWTAIPGTALPKIREPQLVASKDVSAYYEDMDGNVLVGSVEHQGHEVWVLADPDVMNNYGLRQPENARFSVNLIDKLRDDGVVVIDETLHGYAQQPSLLRTLFEFPLVLATMQVLICSLLVVWAAMVRFGPTKVAPPPIAPGKDFLIRNTAALLHYGGHHAHALRRYLHLTVSAVRTAVHAPSLPPTAMTQWLERVRIARGGKVSLVELEKNVETADTPQRVIEVAEHVYRWRMEMTHGSDSRS